jgi:hypothetical protein
LLKAKIQTSQLFYLNAKCSSVSRWQEPDTRAVTVI